MNTIYLYTLTFSVGLFSSFIGSQVGSGGLITIPFLIFIGLPPHVAIGTHKLASLLAAITSLKKYLQSGHVLKQYVLPFTIIGLLGGVLGTQVLLSIDSTLLSKLIGIAILIPIPFLFIHDVGLHHKDISTVQQRIGYIVYGLLSFWAGIF